MKHLTILLMVIALAAAPTLAGAHGGGLNSEGCHRETATNGYHCHRTKGKDVNWETIGIVAGGILALGFILLPFTKRKDPPRFLGTTPDKGFQFVPVAKRDYAGAVLEWRW